MTEDTTHDENDDLFGNNCPKCGIMTCFADDSTVMISSRNRGELEGKLTNKLERATKFLESNGLTINQKKSKNTRIHGKIKEIKTDILTSTTYS